MEDKTKKLYMKHYQINIESKSKKHLENFLIFFLKSLKNYNLINKMLPIKKKRKILTILKSPHVNKKAQEQFQVNIYSKKINLYSIQNKIALLFIKRISSTIFLNVKIQIKFPINSHLIKKSQTKILNPTNFKLNFFNKKSYLNEITRENSKNILSRLKEEKIKNNLIKLKQKKIKSVLVLALNHKDIKTSLLSLIKKEENTKNILLQLKKENNKNTLLQNKGEKAINILSQFKNKKLKKMKQLSELLDIYGEFTNKKVE
jgi:small subunit ribosomal protein S10